MTSQDWIALHRDSIMFVVLVALGVFLIVLGVFVDDEHGLVALGAGALGLPGITAARSGGAE
jgi:hypothetical protein